MKDFYSHYKNLIVKIHGKVIIGNLTFNEKHR